MLDEPPQFSEAFKQTKGRLSISPSGRLVAVVVQYRLTIRDVESLRTVQVFSHDDEVSHVEWSADSLYVLCVLPHRGLCHVWAVDDAEWYCKIDEGPLGVAHARWAPDGRHVLSSSDFGMRLTVWSLLDRSVRYIRAPKFPAAAVAFSAEGGWLAVAERREGVDALGVYECGSFERVAHFALATADVADVCWAPAAAGLVGGGTRGAGAADTSSPDWLLVTDGPLQLALFVYRRDGQLISRLAANSTRPARALGARLSAWAPAGRVVAFGSYDGEVRVLVSRTCHCIAQLLHPRTLRATHADDDRRDPLVFREELLAADQRADGAAHGAAETMVRADSAAMQLQELAESLPHVDTLTRPTHFVPASAAEQPIHLPRRAAAALRDEPLPKIGPPAPRAAASPRAPPHATRVQAALPPAAAVPRVRPSPPSPVTRCAPSFRALGRNLRRCRSGRAGVESGRSLPGDARRGDACRTLGVGSRQFAVRRAAACPSPRARAPPAGPPARAAIALTPSPAPRRPRRPAQAAHRRDRTRARALRPLAPARRSARILHGVVPALSVVIGGHVRARPPRRAEAARASAALGA